jgi:Toprim domain/CHC2 zinc finger
VLTADELAQARATDLRETAERLGSKLKKIATSELAGNCPHCGGIDRFSINIKKNIWHCRGCGTGGDVIKLEMHVNGRSFPEAVEALIGKTSDGKRRQPTAEEIAARKAREEQRRREEVEDRARKEMSAARIVACLQPVAGTPGETYLREVRKIDVNHWAIKRTLEDVDTLGWCERVYFNQPKPDEPHHELNGQYLGAIVAVLTDPISGARTGGISRTFIHQGRKIGKAMSLAGVGRLGIIRLSPDDEVGSGLHICEGIETAMSGMSDPQMNFCPMWAAGSTSQLAGFPVLNGIECLTIVADNDENEASVKAASAAYWRWKDAGHDVHIRQPKERGDLNDIRRRVG